MSSQPSDRGPASARVVAATTAAAEPPLTRSHARRLRTYYRSAGWPCHDALEIELLNARLIERVAEAGTALERIAVTDAGVQALGRTREQNRKAFDAHEALVGRVAQSEAAVGRLVYRGLMLRGRLDTGWKLCSPDVYSIRYSPVPTYTEPRIHEVKVRRADLFSDLRNADKRAAYQALSAAFYYVLPAGLATLDEIPEDCGVLYATAEGFALGRASPRRSVEPTHAIWIALARRAAEPVEIDEAQAWLGDDNGPGAA